MTSINATYGTTSPNLPEPFPGKGAAYLPDLYIEVGEAGRFGQAPEGDR